MRQPLVPIGNKVAYRGGTEVHLTSGFRATEGAHFHAFLHPCDMPGNSFRPKSTQGGPESAGSDTLVHFPGGELVLYPNPTRDALTVRCVSLGEQSTARVRFYDVSGREALSASMQGMSSVLDVSSLSGMYTVVVSSTHHQFVERIVIE